MGGRGAVSLALAIIVGLALGDTAPGGCASLALIVFGLACAALALVALPRTGTVLAVLALVLCALARGSAHVAWFDAGTAAIPAGDRGNPDRFQRARVAGRRPPPAQVSGRNLPRME